MPNPENIVKHQFPKGKSGNLKGRPPKLPQLDKLLDTVLGEEKEGVTAAEAILKALRLKAAKGDVRAAEVLLDRAYGKARQQIDHTTKNEKIQPTIIAAPEVAESIQKLMQKFDEEPNQTEI